MAYDRRALIGVGGWLAFFLVTLVLNGVAVAVITIATLVRFSALTPAVGPGRWHAYLVVTGLLGVAKLAAYVLMAWRLNERQVASTPPLVIRLLWAVVLVPAIGDVLAGMAFLNLAGNAVFVTLGANMGRPLIYAAIWTAYLWRSERVANTYTGHGETDRLAAVFD